MTTYKAITLVILLIVSSMTFGQNSIDTIKRKNYCSETHCTLKPDNPVHFDPYYNWHLCENFNPQQTDFSKEYFDLQIKKYSKKPDQLQQSLKYDFCSIWLSGKSEQNGVIGLNYQRIQFHIDKVVRSIKNADTYFITGKSKVNNNICNFSGELKLLKVFINKCDDTTMKNCGELFASYSFYEDSTQNHSGIFSGIMECSIYLDKTKMLLDNSESTADGYWNRTFIGTWTDYKTKQSKKCIWGDYRLPFTFDFDCGDGEMIVCDKYIKNGWQTFGDGSEYIFVAKDKYEIKNKWWLSIQK